MTQTQTDRQTHNYGDGKQDEIKNSDAQSETNTKLRRPSYGFEDNIKMYLDENIIMSFRSRFIY